MDKGGISLMVCTVLVGAVGRDNKSSDNCYGRAKLMEAGTVAATEMIRYGALPALEHMALNYFLCTIVLYTKHIILPLLQQINSRVSGIDIRLGGDRRERFRSVLPTTAITILSRIFYVTKILFFFSIKTNVLSVFGLLFLRYIDQNFIKKNYPPSSSSPQQNNSIQLQNSKQE
jgi:hypothetical protein